MPNFAYEIKHQNTNIKENDTTLLTISLEYPKFSDPKLTKQNACLERFSATLQALLQDSLHKEASAALNLLPEILPYQLSSTVTPSLQSEAYLSVFFDLFIFAGGVRGAEYRLAQNFHLKSDGALFLTHFFPDSKDLPHTISDQIIAQYPAFHAQAHALRRYFSPERFYLSKDGICIFYNAGQISPLASGIQVFTLPHPEIMP